VAAKDEPESAPKKKKPILLIVIAANVLLGGGAGAFFFLRGNSGAEAHAPNKGHGDDDGGHGDEGHGDEASTVESHGSHSSRQARTQGPIVIFDPIVVNLNEPEGARYLKIGLAVQLANDKLVDAVETAKPVVRDHFIRELSDLNFRQTMGKKNKLSIKRRLIKRFNEALGTDAAVDIHITQFIVQ